MKVKQYPSKWSSKINDEKPGKRSLSSEIQQEIQDGLDAHHMNKPQQSTLQNKVYQRDDEDFLDDDYDCNYSIPEADDCSSEVTAPSEYYPESESSDSDIDETPVEPDDSDDEQANFDSKATRAQKIAMDTHSKYRWFRHKTVPTPCTKQGHGSSPKYK